MTPKEFRCSMCGKTRSPLVSNNKQMFSVCMDCLRECNEEMFEKLLGAELIKLGNKKESTLRMLRPEVVLDILHADATSTGKPAAVIASKFADITPSNILNLIEGVLELIEIEIAQSKSR